MRLSLCLLQKKWDQPSTSGGPPGVQDPKKTCNLETYLDWSSRIRLFVCNDILQVSRKLQRKKQKIENSSSSIWHDNIFTQSSCWLTLLLKQTKRTPRNNKKKKVQVIYLLFSIWMWHSNCVIGYSFAFMIRAQASIRIAEICKLETNKQKVNHLWFNYFHC